MTQIGVGASAQKPVETNEFKNPRWIHQIALCILKFYLLQHTIEVVALVLQAPGI